MEDELVAPEAPAAVVTRLPHSCGCGKRWGGSPDGPAHCSGCHETFSTVGNFDRHRREFACRPPAEIGLIERTRHTAAGDYMVWQMPGQDEEE